MLSSELRARAAKLEQQQKQRTEKEWQRLEKERLLKQQQEQRRAQREEEQRQKRLVQLAEEQQEQENRFELTEHNRGVYLKVQLQALPLDETLASSKRIKRSKDKMLLPGSLSAELMAQDAAKNGTLLFEVATPAGKRTHASVLEFSAPEGVVYLPHRVAVSLFGANGHCQGRVTVQYRRLEKGTYARFQPETRAFHEEVAGEDATAALEAALHAYSTLSEGDLVEVEHAGRTYNLKVQELQPDAAVSVVDTEIAADIGPSLETEEAVRQAEQEARRQEERLKELAARREQEAEQAREEARKQEQLAREKEAQEQALQEETRSRIEASLPPEALPDTSDPFTTCVFRLPDGCRLSRRFLLSEPVQLLFDFVDSKGVAGLQRGCYNLVNQFTRQRVVSGAGGSVADTGIASGQEMFFVERTD